MLNITIPKREFYDETNEEFITLKEQKLQMEHSLISLSKWESKWHKPFLDDRVDKTRDETMDYFKCMTLTQNVDPLVFITMPEDCVNQINAYIENDMTATWFNENNQPKSREIQTSEILYYYMIKLGIPFECQKWHLNRLITLIRVCSLRDNPQKMSKEETLRTNRELNEARKKQHNTKG